VLSAELAVAAARGAVRAHAKHNGRHAGNGGRASAAQKGRAKLAAAHLQHAEQAAGAACELEDSLPYAEPPTVYMPR